MDNDTINKMITRINREIDIAKRHFELRHENNVRDISTINGMITILEIATGKEYYFDENGLHERDGE